MVIPLFCFFVTGIRNEHVKFELHVAIFKALVYALHWLSDTKTSGGGFNKLKVLPMEMPLVNGLSFLPPSPVL